MPTLLCCYVQEDDFGVSQGVFPNFFQLPVIMLMLITVLNDGTLIAIGYDNVIPNTRPDKWNLRAVFFVSSVLAAVACISSLLLLWGCLTSHYDSGIFRKFGLPEIPYEKIITMIYLKVSKPTYLTACPTVGLLQTLSLCVLHPAFHAIITPACCRAPDRRLIPDCHPF